MKSGNKSINSNNKILKIIIQNKEYEITNNEILNILHPFLFKINNRNVYNTKKNFIIFPKNIDKESLDIFLSFLYEEHEKSNITQEPNNKIFDYYYMRKLFNVCIFLNSTSLIERIIKKYIGKSISTQNCLDIIINLTDLIFNKKVQYYFLPVVRKAINVLSSNLPEFIKKNKKEIYSLSNETIEELIEIYINSNNNKTDNNIRIVLELLMHSRRIQKDIFYLLENERKNSLKKFSSEINNEEGCDVVYPKFIWKIKYTFSKNEIYLEKKINLEGLNIALIYYYQPNNDVCQFALQILDDSNFMINSESNENDLSNKKLSNIKVISNYERNFSTNNNLEKINNDVISIIYSCEIPELNFKSRINFNCIKLNNKSRFLIFRINNFMKLLSTNNNNAIENQEFSIKFFLSRNCIFSTIISHIHNNIEQYHKYVSIGKLPDSALQVILDHNPNNDPKIENYKISYLLNWLKENQNYPKYKIAHLSKHINWKIITTNDLLDFFANNTKLLLSIDELKNDIFFEIQRRFQEEYSQIFQNNGNKLFKNNYNITNTNYNNCEEENNINSFTFDFLTKILSLLDYKKNNILTDNQKLVYCQSQNNTNSDIYNEAKKINYTSPVQTDKRNLIKSISQRNIYDTQKPLTKYDKISKSIRLSPSCNNCLGLIEKTKSRKKANDNNKFYKNYNSSLNTDSQKMKKKFNNSTIHYNNKSCDENIGYDEYFKKFLKKSNKKKNKDKDNSFLNKMIKNLNRINTPIIHINDQRIISTNKIENIMNIKPSKVQIVKPHSKSVDKIINQETSNQNKKINQIGNINIIPNVKTKENIIKNNIGLRCFITNHEWTKQLSSKQIDNNINSEIHKSGNSPMIFNKKLNTKKRSCENISNNNKKTG